MKKLKVNGPRLWASLMETAQFGGTPGGGVCRLTLSDADRTMRNWLKTQCESLGCSVAIDEVGNMFAVIPGKRNDLAPIAMGSHLDTQPTGGKFDGILGVLAGVEVVKTMREAGYETNAPLAVVNWTNEEGSRFAPAMLGSGVYAGIFDREFADSRRDQEGSTFREALERIGYRGDAKSGAVKIGAMFELHIEQGPILEAESKTIGIVTGVQGARWYDVRVRGQAAHTGSTPMRMRKNALVAAAKLFVRVDEIALEHAPGGLGAVGQVDVWPNSRNVVPGQVIFTVDFRHPDDSVLEQMEKKLLSAIQSVNAELALDVDSEKIWDSPPVAFNPSCIEAIRTATRNTGYSAREIISGPGHDAKYVAHVAPTAMIFIPCAGGLSHNEQESATSDDCAAGAQVLLDSILEYDARFFAASE